MNSNNVWTDYTSVGNIPTSNPNWANTVTVTVRRSSNSNSNGPLGLFFAPIMGINTQTLSATSTAQITLAGVTGGFDHSWIKTLTGFQKNGANNGTLLPVAVQQAAWHNFMANPSTSQWNVGNSPSGVPGAPAGVPAFQIYPNAFDVGPGNFGNLSLAVGSSPSSSNLGGWVLNGPSSTDLGSFGPSGFTLGPTGITTAGDPGFKSDLVDSQPAGNYQDILGQKRVIPLYGPLAGSSDSNLATYGASGNGNNFTYNIVGFAAVQIVLAQNKTVWAIPTATSDPTATFTDTPPTQSITTGGDSTQLPSGAYILGTAKLIQ